jgi:uncharacterized membrane protein
VVSEERMAALERRTSRLEERLARLDPGVEPRPSAAQARERRIGDAAAAVARPALTRSAATPSPATATPSPAATRPAVAAPRPAAARPAARATGPSGPGATARPSSPLGRVPSWEDAFGGRVLPWVGGVAVLVGLIFFLVIATSRGWIGEEARVVMAAVGSLVLLGAGARLHERRGRNEAALAAAATGIAGLFASNVVAGPVYELVPALAALAAALAIGA